MCWLPCHPRHRSLTASAQQYSSRRFGALNEDETRDMHDYIMNITLAKGSGEYCICQSHHSVLFVSSKVFPSAYIGSWCPRTHAFGRQNLSITNSCIFHLYVPLRALPTLPLTYYIDGEHDWMDPVGGIVSIDNLRAAGNEKARMYIVPRAGHHGKLLCPPLLLLLALTWSSLTVYLDNAKAVNKLIIKELNNENE